MKECAESFLPARGFYENSAMLFSDCKPMKSESKTLPQIVQEILQSVPGHGFTAREIVHRVNEAYSEFCLEKSRRSKKVFDTEALQRQIRAEISGAFLTLRHQDIRFQTLEERPRKHLYSEIDAINSPQNNTAQDCSVVARCLPGLLFLLLLVSFVARTYTRETQ